MPAPLNTQAVLLGYTDELNKRITNALVGKHGNAAVLAALSKFLTPGEAERLAGLLCPKPEKENKTPEHGGLSGR